RHLRAPVRSDRSRARSRAPLVVGRALARDDTPPRGVPLPLLAALPRAALRRDGARRSRLERRARQDDGRLDLAVGDRPVPPEELRLLRRRHELEAVALVEAD